MQRAPKCRESIDHELGFNSFGYVIYLFGGPVSFASKKLKVVALSSAEAEYAAASYTCKEVEFVRNLLRDLGFPLLQRVVLAVDNSAAKQICENMGVTGRTKHFQDAIHYVRHLYDHNKIHIEHVRTHLQRLALHCLLANMCHCTARHGVS